MQIKNLTNFRLYNNRFVLKLFGNLNHDFFTIENDNVLSISKTQLDTFEKKGQISKWTFRVNQIYQSDVSFEEMFENEIENSDFFCYENSNFRTVVFVGDKNDSFSEKPYLNFIRNSVSNILQFNKNEDLITTINFVEITKKSIFDYFNNVVVNNPKVNNYSDEICVEKINPVKIDDVSNFDNLIEISKSNIIKFEEELNENFSNESTSQVLTIRLYNKENNVCFSKINFVLYKAYEITNDECKNNNKNYKLFTKENYSFFSGIHKKINFRINYLLKYIIDTIKNGKNLFIVLAPCEYEFIILLHDLLNYVKMRKLILENFELEENNNNNNNNNKENINFNQNLSNDDNFFNKNFNNKESICSDSTFLSTNKKEENKRTELNEERLKRISNKAQIFDLLNLMENL